jgi:hypothetical protein
LISNRRYQGRAVPGPAAPVEITLTAHAQL